MTNNSTIQWNWIINNMQQCIKCQTYKLLDQFNTNNCKKCKRCQFKKNKTKTNTKPEPFKFDNDQMITKLVVGCYQDIEVKQKIKLTKKKDLK